MRILHVTDVYRPRIGGIEIFVEELAQRQIAAGHDVAVLTSTPGPERGTVPVLRTDLRGGLDARLVTGYDAVHVHLSVVSLLGTLVSRVAAASGIPTVVTVHSMWGGRMAAVRPVAGLAGWGHLPLVWTAVSAAAAADVRRALPRARVQVVPNAVDVAWWAEAATRPRTTGSGVTVLAVMRLAGRKRPLPLLRDLDLVRRQLPEAGLRAVIVGDGPLEPRVRRWINARGAGGWVTLTGAVPRRQVRELCAQADVFVGPAFRESFGIAALEARCAGLPVVAMRHGGVGEFVVSGRDGFLCDDDAGLVAATSRLVGDHDLRAEMSEHNRTVRPVHDWADTLVGFAASYAEAMQRVREHRRSGSHVVGLDPMS